MQKQYAAGNGDDMTWQLSARRAGSNPDNRPRRSDLYYETRLVDQLRALNRCYLEESVIDFASWHAAIDKAGIGLHSSIIDDLKLDGPDAMEFLATFSLKYDVDISDFPFRDYFHDHEFRNRFSFFDFFVRRQSGKAPVPKDLKIVDLVAAVERKKLTGE